MNNDREAGGAYELRRQLGPSLQRPVFEPHSGADLKSCVAPEPRYRRTTKPQGGRGFLPRPDDRWCQIDVHRPEGDKPEQVVHLMKLQVLLQKPSGQLIVPVSGESHFFIEGNAAAR